MEKVNVQSSLIHESDNSADRQILLDVQNLKTHFTLDEGILKAVDGVSFTINRQETLGLIGESGCGKSVTAQSILRIVPRPGQITGGKILFHKRDGSIVDIAGLDPVGQDIRQIRGKEIAIIFQEPMTSLSPVHSIGNQIEEAILLHVTQDKRKARSIALDLLEKVGISNPTQRINEYPHQLSGGMRQRAMIAMALACNPTLLIADEPTTALDVTVQAQILELIGGLQEQLQMSVLYITHNLGVIAETCDRVAVMYLGRVVEYASVHTIFHNPRHPYTIRLLESIPKIGQKKNRLYAIKGNVPVPLNPLPQCGFFKRCPDAISGLCDTSTPALVELEPDHFVRCYLHSNQSEGNIQ